MDTIEKTDFLKNMKRTVKDPKQIALIDEIIDDVNNPLKAFCQQEALYRYDKVAMDLDIATGGEVLDATMEQYFAKRYAAEIYAASEQWINGEFLHDLAEKRFSDMWADLTAKQIEEIPKFQSKGLENHKQETEPIKETNLDL